MYFRHSEYILYTINDNEILGGGGVKGKDNGNEIFNTRLIIILQKYLYIQFSQSQPLFVFLVTILRQA